MSVLGSVLGSTITGLFNSHSAKSVQSSAAQANENMYRNRYQWSVQDLKAAGLNPILAANGLASSSASVGVGSAGAMPDLGASYNSADRIKSVERENVKNLRAQADAAMKTADANAKNAQTQEKVGESTSHLNYTNASEAMLNGITNRANNTLLADGNFALLNAQKNQVNTATALMPMQLEVERAKADAMAASAAATRYAADVNASAHRYAADVSERLGNERNRILDRDVGSRVLRGLTGSSLDLSSSYRQRQLGDAARFGNSSLALQDDLSKHYQNSPIKDVWSMIDRYFK